MAQSNKMATFETFADKHVLTDGTRTIEIHKIAGGGHNDAFAMVYLPKEKILIEGDAFTPPAANAPPPAAVNPFAVNLDENITRLKLDVKQIAALHGPRVATMADLKAFIAPRSTN
jgi:glyoxylase-like metal-dependent hydrolase (beta-lactamase superfamily II)